MKEIKLYQCGICHTQYADNWEGFATDFAFKEAGMVFRTIQECKAALPALRKKYLGVENNE